MPRLTDKERKSINERMALQVKLLESFKGRQFVSQHCRLCNWASNGRTLEEAIKANKEHEATHPEIAQFRETELSPSELVASLHDHDCQLEFCACKCGCQSGPFCVLVDGPLCSACQVRESRGDKEHGEKKKRAGFLAALKDEIPY